MQIPEEFRGKDVELLLGRIDDVDEAWLNGTRIGGTGSFPPNYQSAWSVERRYSVPASLVRGNGADVLAVRVFDGKGDGGIAAAGMKSLRVGPFDPQLSVGGHFTGYTLGGIGWYRKHFRAGQIGSHIAIHFDGVYMNAAVWINGHFLGEHPHGYTSFAFDLTPHLNAPGEDNVIAVRVRNEGRNSRWYSGSGIYRHVWLTTTGPVHVPTHGLFVTTPEVSADKALVKLSVEICNAADAPTKTFIRAQVRNPQGRVVGSSEGEVHLVSGETRRTEQFVEFPAPVFWSVDSPHLYRAEVELIDAGKVVDTVATTFGIRTIAFGADQGFQLNGESLLLKGGCIHHDNGPLGAAAIDRAEERKVELLKANGFNAIRSAHNPPSSALLEACDRLGMLVIDEAFDQWKLPKENRSHG